jgi:hypothetical protein
VPQLRVSLTIVIDDTSQGKAKGYNAFVVHASLMIVHYDRHNIFIVQATCFGKIVE